MLDAKPTHNPVLAWREIEGEVIIISPADSVVHALNSSASFLWKRVNGKKTVAEIAAELGEEYDVPAEAALADTQELFVELRAKRLLDFPSDDHRDDHREDHA